MLFEITAANKNYEFRWDLKNDVASCRNRSESKVIWTGSLLPSFHISSVCGEELYEDGRVIDATEIAPGRWNIVFKAGSSGVGDFCCELPEWGFRLFDLKVKWEIRTSIIGMYFGSKKIDEEKSRIVPVADRKYWPDWRADEFCVPCTGSSPTTSFWRKWDWGNAAISLGSYGPAMGTPYSAAFPRPLYACSMGGKNGWIAAGPGEIPDGALTLRINSAAACLEYLYREDLWGSSRGDERSWKEPLRLAWADNAYNAYAALFKSLEGSREKAGVHSKSFCGTWGAFGKGDFDLRRQADRYAGELPADVMLIDDYWETFLGSGVPNHELFPEFEKDLEYIREKGMEIGLWQSIGWIRHPESVGLGAEDLLCGTDGRPRLTQWIMDPYASKDRLCYCLDPSSSKTRKFLEERTGRIIKAYNPAVLKLDFGYGLPGPDVCTPRDPAFRGEKLCLALLDIIVKAAREVKPDITIIYYGINPLLFHSFDLLSFDDMGDCGSSADYEIAGHSQRCLWASLVSSSGMALNTSSGYYWKAFSEILLDTAVAGVNGSVLPETDEAGMSISPFHICRWRAIQKWRRKTPRWKPLWLDANFGGSGSEPKIGSWARIEGPEGTQGIFSAALRGKGDGSCFFYDLKGIEFTGKWGLISQDSKDIFSSRELAVIPFSKGCIKINREFGSVKLVKLGAGSNEKTEALKLPAGNGLTLAVSEEDLTEYIGYLIYRDKE